MSSSQHPLGRFWLTLTVFTSIALLHCFTQNLDLFSFNRIAIEKGEWWRLVTGHFVHSDNQHLLWNIVALALLGAMLEQHSRRLFLQSMVVGIVAVDALLFLSDDAPMAYCGFSGVLNAMFLALLYREYRRQAHWSIPLIAIAALLKIVVESRHGAVFSHTAWPAYPAAHAAAYAAATLMVVITYAKRYVEISHKRGKARIRA